MADLPTSEGWLAVLAAVGGAALAATHHAIAGFVTWMGWRRSSAEREQQGLKKLMRDEIAAERVAIDKAIQDGFSEIRQHVAAIQKGVEGKQAVMQDQLSRFYIEMRDRDEKLAEGLHSRISSSMRTLEDRISKQIDTSLKHLIDILRR